MSDDRAVGALTGLAVGDALGVPLEFAPRDRHPEIRDLVGGGPFGLPPGVWTDDTSMALCLADSLLAQGRLDPHDVMSRFVRWYRRGENSATGHCFDIGNATLDALLRFERSGDPIAGSSDPHTAGNGSLMRLAPVAIWFRADRAAAVEAAREQSRLTHATPEAVDACGYFAGLLVDAINGTARTELFAATPIDAAPRVADIAAGSYHGRGRETISASGYVIHTLEAALWCVSTTQTAEAALILAANLAQDSDTVAAVTGQLAGALYGHSALPARWWARLHDGPRIETLARTLVARSAQPAAQP